MQGKTLIIALESVFHYDPETGCGLRPTTAALLSDYRALGYSLVAFFSLLILVVVVETLAT